MTEDDEETPIAESVLVIERGVKRLRLDVDADELEPDEHMEEPDDDEPDDDDEDKCCRFVTKCKSFWLEVGWGWVCCWFDDDDDGGGVFDDL